MIKGLLESRVLIGGPFVKQIDRTIFEIGGEQGEAFTLSLGKLRSRKHSFVDVELVIELELEEILAGLIVELWCLQSEQTVKEEKVGEDHCEVLAIPVTILIRNWFTVNAQLTRLWRIESNQKFCECRLAAAIASGDKHELTGRELQINRPKREASVFGFAIIAMSDPTQFYSLPCGQLFGCLRCFFFRCISSKRQAQRFHLLQSNVGAGHRRQHDGDEFDWHHYEEQQKHVARQNLGTYIRV